MSAPAKIPIPWAVRLGDLVRGPLPLLIWLAAGLGALLLLRGRPGPGVLQGVVVEPTYPLAFGAAGEVQQWLVVPGARVGAGEPIALLSQDDLALTEAAVSSRLQALEAEVDAVRSRLGRRRVEGEYEADLQAWSQAAAELEGRRDARSDSRRFGLDAAELRIDALAAEVALAVADLERGRVRVRLERGRALAAQDLFDAATVQDLELELAQVEAEVEARQAQTAAVDAARDEALARLAALDAAESEESIPRSNDGLAPVNDALARELEAEIAVVLARMEIERVELRRLELQRAGRVLTAPADGLVGEPWVLAGQYTRAGEEVAQLRVPSGARVELWLPAGAVDQAPEVGAELVLARPGARAPRAASRVVEIAGVVTALPAHLQADPARPVYGRALVVTMPAELELLPGEVVLGWSR